ncbi:MAG: hypothetical protein H6722_32345 [Sandaracinus sp.]|nr:hypothetical protein [Sandaracinus sp.]
MLGTNESVMWLAVRELPDDLQTWLEGQTSFEEAWALCERPDWLVALALSASIDRHLVVAASCDVLERARLTAELPEAFQLAKGWTRGQVDGRACWAAGFRAAAAAKVASDAASRLAAKASASLAFACDTEADDGYYASRAHAAEAVMLAATTIDSNERVRLAQHVRRRIPVEAVREGLEGLGRRRSSMPPPVESVDAAVHVRPNSEDSSVRAR